MEFTTALVMILSLIGFTTLLIFAGGVVKAEGDLDFVTLIMGVASSSMAFVGIQSGLKTDYAVSIAIVGLLSLFYATLEARDDLRTAKAKFISRHSPGLRIVD
jgi:hypothetical protein